MIQETPNQSWAVIYDDSNTYVKFGTKAEASKWAEQFCPIGEDGEGDMNCLILPENHQLIISMGWTEREVK